MTPAYATRLVGGGATDPGQRARLLEFFTRSHNDCFCQYWFFEGDKNEWLARCAFSADRNREALCAALGDSRSGPSGLVAHNGAGEVVGWLRLSPTHLVPKLYQQRYYRARPELAGSRDGGMVVCCVLTRPDVRRQGVARSLIAAVPETAKKLGAAYVDALPYAPGGDAHDEVLLAGPEIAYLEAGFTVLDPSRPYPILRWQNG